jgi:hypothetical protein
MEAVKKERIEQLNKEFEERKKVIIGGQKDRQIQEASQKLMVMVVNNTTNNASRLLTPSSHQNNNNVQRRAGVTLLQTHSISPRTPHSPVSNNPHTTLKHLESAPALIAQSDTNDLLSPILLQTE